MDTQAIERTDTNISAVTDKTVATMSNHGGAMEIQEAIAQTTLDKIEADALAAWAAYKANREQLREARRVVIEAYGKNAIMSLYFIQNESGFIKIGQSENPHTRFANLQQGNVETLTLLKIVPPSFSPTGLTEKQVHKRFKHLRVRGEWFRPAQELLDFIGGCNDTHIHG